jgi:hypothetical protein
VSVTKSEDVPFFAFEYCHYGDVLGISAPFDQLSLGKHGIILSADPSAFCFVDNICDRMAGSEGNQRRANEMRAVKND